MKTSFQKEHLCKFPSFEHLLSYWKSEVLVQAHPLYQKDSDIVIGMFYDPLEYIPKHLERWLKRRELEGSPLPPGYYKVRFKVINDLFLLSEVGSKMFNIR